MLDTVYKNVSRCRNVRKLCHSDASTAQRACRPPDRLAETLIVLYAVCRSEFTKMTNGFLLTGHTQSTRFVLIRQIAASMVVRSKRFYILRHFKTKLRKTKYAICARDCSWQRLPFNDILCCFGNVRDKVAKLSKITQKLCCFWAAKVFWVATPNF